jgi:bromodomain-containing factor 1
MREVFGRDVRKVLDNAMLYNPESDLVYKAAASILDVFTSNWSFSAPVSNESSKKKEKKKSVGLIDENAPVSEPSKKKEKKKSVGPIIEDTPVSNEPSKKKEKKKSIGLIDENAPVSNEPSLKKEKKKSVGPMDEDVSPEPKKRKVPKWLQRCKDELSHLMAIPDAELFLQPVNAQELRLKDYHKIIQRPMDLGTIMDALECGSISKYEEFNDMVSACPFQTSNCMFAIN